MKRFMALILTIVMSFSFVACGNSNSTAEKAYDDITTAYKIAEDFSDDVYDAWRLGISHKSEIRSDAVKYLAKELSLSEEDVIEGMVYTWFYMISDKDYETASEEEKQEFRESTDVFIKFMETYTGNDLFAICVLVVNGIYATNGETAQAEAALAEAKELIKKLGDDDEYTSGLKEYYKTTSSLLSYCQEPTGTFEQVQDTVNKYKNDARDCCSELEIAFE